MTKKSAKTTLLDSPESLAEHREEMQGGLPSQETESVLAQDEKERPIQDADFFDYCMMSFERQGKAICYYIKKNGKYLTTLKPPCDWDKLRSLFGPGHYLVQCKDELSNAFLKQKSEVLDELPVQPSADSGESSHPFGFATQAPSNDLTPILTLMQHQNEMRAQQEREDRQRDENRRREERQRDEDRRREERESRNDLLKTLIPAAAPFLAALMPKKDDHKLDTLVEFMKESSREARLANDKLLERLERTMQEKKGDLDPLALVKMLNESKKDGRLEMQELLDMVEERAESRAAQMGGGDGEESTLALLIKNLGPGLSALMAQSVAKPGTTAALPEPGAVAGDAIEAQAEPVAAAPPPKPRTPDEVDQEQILAVVLPFFADQFARMQNNHKVEPKAAAKESLVLLKAKGFKQERVIQVFTKDILFKVLRSYQIPKEYDSWFNDYYAALVVKETEAPLRSKSNVQSLRTESRSKGTRDNAPQSGGSAGFVPAAAPATAVVAKPSVVETEGKHLGPNGIEPGQIAAGPSTESAQQLST
jgi:hypothetical protein